MYQRVRKCPTIPTPETIKQLQSYRKKSGNTQPQKRHFQKMITPSCNMPSWHKLWWRAELCQWFYAKITWSSLLLPIFWDLYSKGQVFIVQKAKALHKFACVGLSCKDIAVTLKQMSLAKNKEQQTPVMLHCTEKGTNVLLSNRRVVEIFWSGDFENAHRGVEYLGWSHVKFKFKWRSFFHVHWMKNYTISCLESSTHFPNRKQEAELFCQHVLVCCPSAEAIAPRTGPCFPCIAGCPAPH